MRRFLRGICICFFSSIFAASNVSIYVVNYTDSTIYQVDSQTGAATLVTPAPVGPLGGLVGIKLASQTTAYTINNGNSHAYFVDLTNGSFTQVSNTPIGAPGPLGATNLALASDTLAYVPNQSDGNLYSLNLVTGDVAQVNTISPVSTQPSSIALKDNTAYITDYLDPSIYAVDLTTGASSVIGTPLPSTGLSGIAILGETAYVVDYYTNSFYSVDLLSGAYSFIATIDTAGPYDVALLSDQIAYTAGGDNNIVYAVNLQTGAVTVVTPSPVPGTLALNSGLFGLDLFGGLSTSCLTGNNLQLAQYLCTYGSLNVIVPLSTLTCTNLEKALEFMAPTRNAFSTYASQIEALGVNKIVSDHQRLKRLTSMAIQQKELALRNVLLNELHANADENSVMTTSDEVQEDLYCCRENNYTAWIAPFGEYAREHRQHQTPAFSMGSGGFVAALDYNGMEANLVGMGGAYVRTHIHEEDGAGHADINQGLFSIYGTMNVSKWYFDLIVWGGYYSSSNERNIRFPGVDETAKSKIKGWQLIPHLEIGYDGFFLRDCCIKWFGVEPFIMIDWVGNWEQGFNEHGAGSFNMGQKGRFCYFIRGETGLRFHQMMELNWGYLVFREKGAYTYQKAFDTGLITAFLVSAPGSFTVSTLTGAQNLGVVQFSMLFRPHASIPYFDLRYQGEFGSRYQSHQGILEVGMNF